MNHIRLLLHEAGALSDSRKGALKIPGLDPWSLRADGLDRRLTGPEFAVALGHIAKHRGFRSNSKRDHGANGPKESSDMLKAIEQTRESLTQYRTVGEMFAKSPLYAVRKHNRDGDYTRSILRRDQEHEVRLLFRRQRAAGNQLATEALEERYMDEAFSQRPLADSAALVGVCPFEPNEKRAAKHAYSFELFRLLCRLTSLHIQSAGAERPLSATEISCAISDFGASRGMTFRRMRKLAGLAENERFIGVTAEDEAKRDVVSRTGDLAAGTYALRAVLGPTWQTLIATPEILDQIAFVLAFREDIASIKAGLQEIGLEPPIFDALARGVERGSFAGFRGAGHISTKACRNVIHHLKQGVVYSAACAATGYNHAQQPETDPKEIRNPIARKSLCEAIKQVRAIVHEYGLPGKIHLELARDVGKSKEERDEITRGIEKRNKAKDRLREQFKEDVGTEATSGEDLLRYELWREQNGRCLYTDRAIHPNAIVASDNSVQVDHILPWSRSGDDSFVNKTLCFASANQQKKGRTPWEWFGAEFADPEWEAFSQRIETNKQMKGRKKRNYLLRDSSVLATKFYPRNLNDTRYACRLLRNVLARMYPEEGDRRVFTRPGTLTDRMRRAWGVQNLKKDGEGNRVDDDRHHALDALVVAATTEGALNRLTRAFQEAERVGAHRDFAALAPPWPGFIGDARANYAEIFISRAERCRARGEGHGATIRQVLAGDAIPTIYERRHVESLVLGDLKRIKDAERNIRIVEAIREWIDAGKPKDRRPMSPKGDPISRIRIQTGKKLDVLVRDGAAERGEMVRVDMFRKQDRRELWQFFCIPIYPHQVADRHNFPYPPNRAIQANTPEHEWPQIDGSYEFLWSLYPFSFLELMKSDGELLEGYVRSINRNTGALVVSPHTTRSITRQGIGTRTLRSVRKFAIDRLGRRFEIRRETRTWHGVACM